MTSIPAQRNSQENTLQDELLPEAQDRDTSSTGNGKGNPLLLSLLPDEHGWSSDDDEIVYIQDATASAPEPKGRRLCSFKCCGLCTVAFVVCMSLVMVFAVPPLIEASLSTAELELGVVNITSPTLDSVRLDCDATMHLKTPPQLSAIIRKSNLKFRVRSSEVNDDDDDDDDEEEEEEDNGEGAGAGGGGGEWLTVGCLALPSIASEAGEKTLSLSVQGAALSDVRADGWALFTRQVVTSAQVSWRLEGTVDVELEPWSAFTGGGSGGGSGGGWFTLLYRNIPLSLSSSSVGMNGFVDPLPFIETYDAFSDSLDAYPTQVAGVRLFNPSAFQILPLGQVVMDMRFEGSSMGWTATTQNISMHKGWNFLTLEGPLQPTNLTKVGVLMSRFYGGEASHVVMHISNYTGCQQIGGSGGGAGDSESGGGCGEGGTGRVTRLPACSQPLYAGALQDFDIPTVLRNSEGKVNLTTEAVWETTDQLLVSTDDSQRAVTLPLWAGVLNPFSSHMFVTDMVASVLFRPPGESAMAEVAAVDEHGLWIPIAPNGASLTGTDMNTSLVATINLEAPEALEVLAAQLHENGYLYIALKGSFGLRIGALQLTFEYWQAQNVPCCDLNYAQCHHGASSVCNTPPTDMIVGAHRNLSHTNQNITKQDDNDDDDDDCSSHCQRWCGSGQ